MKQIVFQRGGQQFVAWLGHPGTKNIRLAWPKGAVPPAFAAEVKRWAKRPGLMTVKLPLNGPNAITVVRIEELEVHEGEDAYADGPPVQGVATAELARGLALLLRERRLTDRMEVLCSHPGAYRGTRKRELREAGVLICHLAMFLGDDHAFDTKVGVTDIAMAEKAPPYRTLVLIEIEEAKAGTKPKTVLGDALLPFVADRVEIVERTNTRTSTIRTLNMDGAEIWVGYHPRAGYDVRRTERLESRLNAFVVRGRLEGAAGPSTIRLLNDPPEILYSTLHRMVADLLTARFCRPVGG